MMMNEAPMTTLSLLITALLFKGCRATKDTVFIVSAVAMGGKEIPKITCLIGSYNDDVTSVRVSARRSVIGKYHMQGHGVIAFPLNITLGHRTIKRYPALVILGTGHLTVTLVADSKGHISRCLILPVVSWDTTYYLTYPHSWLASFQVLSAFNRTQVRIYSTPRQSPQGQHTLSYSSELDNGGMIVELSEYEVFVVEFVDNNTVQELVSSGLKVKSTLPVVILSSGSTTTAARSSLDSKVDGTNSSVLINGQERSPEHSQMVLPKLALGREYVLPTAWKRSSSVDHYVIISTEPRTGVVVWDPWGPNKTSLSLLYSGDTRSINNGSYVKGSKPIYVYLFHLLARRNVQELTWCPILPVSLFYHIYLWSLHQTPHLGPSLHTVLIGVVSGYGTHVLQTYNTNIKFGCYLLTLDDETELLQPADVIARWDGFKYFQESLSAIQYLDKRQSDTTIDAIFAIWTAWEFYKCVNPCNISYSIVSTRHCVVSFREPTDPSANCLLGVQEDKTEYMACPWKTTCPDDCPAGTWYYNCTHTCGENCLGDCNKFTGACSKCKSGFTHDFRYEHCQKECPPYTYGENCEGSCIQKCGSDCADREDGSCSIAQSGNTLVYLSIVVSVIVVMLVNFCLQGGKTRKTSNDASSEASGMASHGQEISELLKNIKDNKPDHKFNYADSSVYKGAASNTPSDVQSIVSLYATDPKKPSKPAKTTPQRKGDADSIARSSMESEKYKVSLPPSERPSTVVIMPFTGPQTTSKTKDPILKRMWKFYFA